MEPDQITRALFEEWGESLFRHAYRLSRSPETADDLVQEAFLALYQELRRGTSIENPRAWMLGLITHKAARTYRDLSRWRRSDSFVLEAVPAPQPDEERRWDAADDELAPLLDRLSARESEVVLLRLQSLKYREIAEKLGISHKSVATLLARALAKMRQGVARGRAQGQRQWIDWRDEDASLQ